MINTDLPIGQILETLRATLRDANELVLEAAPGAGKTTIVPLALLHEPWLGKNKIILLEPRRMAARAAAQRMADLLREPVGATVGYRVRLESKVGPNTRIEVITEGILTRMLQSDPALDGVALVIFDEFHERNLDSDLGLALALQGRELFRKADQPLKLLVMSATLDGVAVAGLLEGAPVISCEGRQYPVRVQHGKTLRSSDSLIEPVVKTLNAVLDDPACGSVLVFLPGQGEIRRVVQSLPSRDGVVVSPLYGGLSLAEQQRAIEPVAGGQRKIVLATNIAETSLTIDGITTVIDSGLAREPVYDPGTGMTRLQLGRISRSAATQRMGRAGRLGPGQCFRLWSEQQQQQLVPHATAEMLQADLAPLALQLLAWGVGDPAELAWLDPPPAGPYQAALALLAILGAAKESTATHWRLLPYGEKLAQLPLHPRLAHLLLQGTALGLGETAAALAALLSERDPLSGLGGDLGLRLAIVRGDASCPHAQRGWLQRVRQQAKTFARLCDKLVTARPDTGVDVADAGALLLAYAYPDRIARQLAGKAGGYQLSSGRHAELPVSDELSRYEWLVVADIGGRVGQTRDRIYLAAALNPVFLKEELKSLTQTHDVAAWDESRDRFIAERRLQLGQLVLSSTALEQVGVEERTRAVIELLMRRGLDLLPWSKTLRQWQARVILLREFEGEEWPEVSNAHLLATLDKWLAPWLGQVAKLSDLQQLDLAAALHALLPWPLPARLDELAPLRVEVPSGSSYPLDYTQSPPVLAVKLQEMFGAESTPCVLQGKLPLMVHLLSPAGRPLQVTRDLAGFWSNAYIEVKKEMKGRYPKHPWPDDPLTAQPTRHTKKRLARDS